MAGQLLGSRFALHDVEDVESFCSSIVQRVRFKLAAHEREELHVYLIETAWEISRNFRPGGITFSSYAGTTLRLRCVDWHRSHFGRQRWAWSGGKVYERPHAALVSLDADDSERDRLEATLGGRSLDSDLLGFADEFGLSIVEVASQVGETTGWVTKKLRRLRLEIERQS